MRIDENKVFVYNFDSLEMGGGCSFPIRAQSREEATDILQKCLSRFQTELAMEFPKTAPVSAAAGMQVGTGSVPAEVLELRIDKLMKDLGATNLTDAAMAKTVENWTGLLYTPENYVKIVTELELFVSGQKDLPGPGGKKKA